MEKSLDMYKIAVTGSAGSGKSVVCMRLKALGLPVLSSDELAREAVLPGMPAYKKIVAYFGKKILTDDGQLNRQLMREIITKDNAAKKVLEGFVHPEIFSLMIKGMEDAQKNGSRVIVIEVPLLFELGMEELFDLVILVSIDRDIQIKRLMARDQVTSEGAEALLAIQMPEDKKIQKAGVIIRNSGTIDEMTQAVDGAYRDIVKAKETFKNS
ncbi:MAG: dephospho-CoA kinase [Proteobacteria bacterium]|nr:dephospho-CoA kinase [Pseudomonadota bacterium]